MSDKGVGNTNMNCMLLTGSIEYKGINFTFSFKGESLHLIPPADKKDEIRMKWFMTEIAEGMYTFGPLPKVDAPFLIGLCSETGRTMVFIPAEGAFISNQNSVLAISIAAYIECGISAPLVTKITFTSPEIDYIAPISQGYLGFASPKGCRTKGILNLMSEDCSESLTEKRAFVVDGIDVQVSFGISKTFSNIFGQAPLAIHSAMMMEFAPTKDYAFLLRLWSVAKEFIQYMCYRRNVFLSGAVLSSTADNRVSYNSATLNVVNETGDNEPAVLRKKQHISLSPIFGYEHLILNDIAAHTLYTQHLPDTHASGKRINAARFIMTTAAFEREFSRIYPAGIKKSETLLKAEQEASAQLQTLISGSSGKLKSVYKHMQSLPKSSLLQAEIIRVGKDFHKILSIFGKQLYSLRDADVPYSDIGERLANLRNQYAFGNLDINLSEATLLDIAFLERIIYVMQLTFYGIDTKSIKQATNELFGCMLYIP